MLLEVVFAGKAILARATTSLLRAVKLRWTGVMNGFDMALEVSLASENAPASGFQAEPLRLLLYWTDDVGSRAIERPVFFLQCPVLRTIRTLTLVVVL